MWTLVTHLSKHGCLWFCSAVVAKVCLHSDRPFIIHVWGYNCSNYSEIGAVQLVKQQNEKIYHMHPLQLLPHSWPSFSLFVHHKDLQICTFYTVASDGNHKKNLQKNNYSSFVFFAIVWDLLWRWRRLLFMPFMQYDERKIRLFQSWVFFQRFSR